MKVNSSMHINVVVGQVSNDYSDYYHHGSKLISHTHMHQTDKRCIYTCICMTWVKVERIYHFMVA